MRLPCAKDQLGPSKAVAKREGPTHPVWASAGGPWHAADECARFEIERTTFTAIHCRTAAHVLNDNYVLKCVLLNVLNDYYGSSDLTNTLLHAVSRLLR